MNVTLYNLLTAKLETRSSILYIQTLSLRRGGIFGACWVGRAVEPAHVIHIVSVSGACAAIAWRRRRLKNSLHSHFVCEQGQLGGHRIDGRACVRWRLMCAFYGELRCLSV